MDSEEKTGTLPQDATGAKEIDQETTQEQGEVQRLRGELEEQTSKAGEYLDQWKRAVADLSNYRKRQARDEEQRAKWATANLLQDLLPVLDDLELALHSLDGEEQASWAQGVELVAQKMRDALAKTGLEEILAEPGAAFDPSVHEAIVHQESDAFPDGSILKVIRKGYKLGDRVLRPAMVMVAKGS